MARLFVCGDIIHNVEKTLFIGERLANVISAADYAIGNLEGVELNSMTQSNSPIQTPGTIDYLCSVGFNLMLLANNHITDQGISLFKDTIVKIEKNCLSHIGAGLSWEDVYNKECIKSIAGCKFGFLNVCEAQVGQFKDPSQLFGYAWTGYFELFDKVKNLSEKVDYVIVFVHAGLEHYNLPLPEIRSFYRRLCDAGASCVIGGHPHIVQGYEWYNESFIAYSLGNFYFPHKKGEYPKESTAFSLLLEFEKDCPVKVETIHHRLENDVVELINKELSGINEKELCCLLDEDYENSAERMCVEAYNKLCRKLLEEALCGEKEELSNIELFKSTLRRTVFRRKYITSTKLFRDTLLLRLFENETYRYTIIRALKSKQK